MMTDGLIYVTPTMIVEAAAKAIKRYFLRGDVFMD